METDKVVKALKFIKDNGPVTLTSVSNHIGSDIRTTSSLLNGLSTSDLGIMNCSVTNAGTRTFSSYSLANVSNVMEVKKYGKRKD